MSLAATPVLYVYCAPAAPMFRLAVAAEGRAVLERDSSVKSPQRGGPATSDTRGSLDQPTADTITDLTTTRLGQPAVTLASRQSRGRHSTPGLEVPDKLPDPSGSRPSP